MATLFDAAGLQLHWVQPSIFARQFDLYSENRRLGELHFENAAKAYCTLALADSATARWTLRGAGFWKRRVTIRESDATNDLAVFRPKLRGDGWVEFLAGSRFHWDSRAFWRAEWGFSNIQEELLFVFKSKRSHPLKIQSIVQLESPSHNVDELPMLLMLGWYLRVQDFYAGW